MLIVLSGQDRVILIVHCCTLSGQNNVDCALSGQNRVF